MRRDRTFNDLGSACRWACGVFGGDTDPSAGTDLGDRPVAEDPEPMTDVDPERTTIVSEEELDGLLVTRREDDREFAETLANSPWERMLREAAASTGDRPD